MAEEELFDVQLIVNGAAHNVRVPARRLLSDCIRHDLRLTGTHVGCEHGVCGACTVLVDGAAMRSCLLLAVSVDGSRITTVEGLTEPDGTLSPVQQAFEDCHGLQCGFCTPGFLTTITAGLRTNPEPTEDDARELIGGNLCRCTGYQNIVGVGAAGGRDPARAGRTMTKMFGEPVARVEDDRLVRGQRRLPRRPRPRRAGRRVRAQPARARRDPRHRRHRCPRRRRPGRDLHLRGPARPPGRAAAAAHPAPVADPRPHPVRAGPRRRQPRRRADRHGGRAGPLPGRGRRRADPRQLPAAACGGRYRGGAGGRAPGAPRRPGQRRREHGAERRRRRRGAAQRAARPRAGPVDRALGLDADGGPRRPGPLGPGVAPAADVDLDADVHRASGPPSPRSSGSRSSTST